MKKRKINWGAIGKFILLILSGAILIEHFYMLAIYPFITGELTGLSWWGLFVTLLALFVFANCYEDLRERIQK